MHGIEPSATHYSLGTGVLFEGGRETGKMTAALSLPLIHLLPRLRMAEAVPLIPLHAIMTLTGKILPYFSCPAFCTSVLIFCVFNFADVQCMVSSQVPYTLKAYWGVSIRELHLSLWRPWSVLEGQMQQGTILQDHYQHKGSSLQYPLSCMQFSFKLHKL